MPCQPISPGQHVLNELLTRPCAACALKSELVATVQAMKKVESERDVAVRRAARAGSAGKLRISQSELSLLAGAAFVLTCGMLCAVLRCAGYGNQSPAAAPTVNGPQHKWQVQVSPEQSGTGLGRAHCNAPPLHYTGSFFCCTATFSALSPNLLRCSSPVPCCQPTALPALCLSAEHSWRRLPLWDGRPPALAPGEGTWASLLWMISRGLKSCDSKGRCWYYRPCPPQTNSSPESCSVLPHAASVLRCYKRVWSGIWHCACRRAQVSFPKVRRQGSEGNGGQEGLVFTGS